MLIRWFNELIRRLPELIRYLPECLQIRAQVHLVGNMHLYNVCMIIKYMKYNESARHISQRHPYKRTQLNQVSF